MVVGGSKNWIRGQISTPAPSERVCIVELDFFEKDIPEWSALNVLQPDMLMASCNGKVKKVISDTGVLLYTKSARSEKEDFDDEACLFRFAEKLSEKFYPQIGLH